MNEGESAGGGHQGSNPAPPAVPDRRSILPKTLIQTTHSSSNTYQTTPSVVTVVTTNAPVLGTLTTTATVAVTPLSFQQVFTQQQLQQHQKLQSLSGSSNVSAPVTYQRNQQQQLHMPQTHQRSVPGAAASSHSQSPVPAEHGSNSPASTAACSFISASSDAGLAATDFPLPAKRPRIVSTPESATDNVVDAPLPVTASALDSNIPVRNRLQEIKLLRMQKIKENLDKMLHQDELAAGSIWEICGSAGVGKSQFCHTVALNFTSAHPADALYIDTKRDFSGTRIRQILRARNIDKAQSGRIMNQIRIHRALSAESVIGTLKELLTHLETGSREVSNIKLVIIDALPAVWFNFCDDETHLCGKFLLSKLSNLMLKLASQYFVAFIVVNLTFIENQSMVTEDIIDKGSQDCSSHQYHCNEPQTRLALGSCWSSTPGIRLSLEKPEEEREGSPLRLIRIVKRCYKSTGDGCFVYLTEAGVI